MPYILYTLGAAQRKLSIIVNHKPRGIWARARVAHAHYARIPRLSELRALLLILRAARPNR